MTSEAQRITGDDPALREFEYCAFIGIELHEDRFTDFRPQRRMATRQQRTRTDLHLEINGFTEEDLLLDPSLPDVLTRGPRLCELHVLGTHRQRNLLVHPHVRRPFDFD